MRFCLQLDKSSKIHVKELLILNWLSVYDRNLQFIASEIVKFYNDQSLEYFDKIFYHVVDNSVIIRPSDPKLKLPFRKINLGTPNLFYVGPNLSYG